MRIFVNNVDGFLAGAICADLCKLSHTILGTRKGRHDALVPPFIRRIVLRTDVRKLLKAVASCDLIVYDLHDADLEELELVLQALHKSEITQDMTFILVSSVGCWARTQRTFEPMMASPDGATQDPSATGSAEESPEAVQDGESAAADAEGDATASATDATLRAASRRPVSLRSEDYTRRIPAPKFQEWKTIETLVLALRDKPTVRPYVVCAAIPYGNGEDAFLGLFKAAWQSRDTLRIIGDGSNFVPCVHARDVARLVRRVAETKPDLEYHVAVDRGESTQKVIIDAVAAEFGVGYDVQTVSIPEALLAELADILTLDLRFEPSPLMPVGGGEERVVTPAGEHVAAEEGVEEGEREPVVTTRAAFRWWCESGLPANIATVAAEFCDWRRLKPVRLLILGPPGSGANKLVPLLSERYAIEGTVLEEAIEGLRNTDTPLGNSLKEALDQITAAFGNPKSQGPFLLPAQLMCQVADDALMHKIPVRYRGFVLSGFPTNMEELDGFFLEDAPVPEAPAEGEPPRPASDEKLEKVFKASVMPDAVIVLTSSDEACQQRAQHEVVRPLTDGEFKKELERWKKEMPEDGSKLTDAFVDRGIEPLVINMDETSLTDMVEQVAAHLENKRAIYNFRLSTNRRGAGQKDEQAAETAPPADEGAAQKEAENRRKKKEEEDRLEAIKREEFVRLEKHSEPLRQYLMSFVVPTLTHGLIDVCRDTPEDPIAYLADYLSIYSTQLAESRRRQRRKQLAEAASVASLPS